MHHRDARKPTTEHPPVLIKAEEASSCSQGLERNMGEAGGDLRLTGLPAKGQGPWPHNVEQLYNWIGLVWKVLVTSLSKTRALGIGQVHAVRVMG